MDEDNRMKDVIRTSIQYQFSNVWLFDEIFRNWTKFNDMLKSGPDSMKKYFTDQWYYVREKVKQEADKRNDIVVSDMDKAVSVDDFEITMNETPSGIKVFIFTMPEHEYPDASSKYIALALTPNMPRYITAEFSQEMATGNSCFFVGEFYVDESGKKAHKNYGKLDGMQKENFIRAVLNILYSNANPLDKLIEETCGPDPFWVDAVKKYFNSINNRSDEVKLDFYKKLIKEKDLFGEFTKDIIKPDADKDEIFNRYTKLLLEKQQLNVNDTSNMQEVMEKTTYFANLKLHAQCLFIPILDGFAKDPDEGFSPQIIMSYSTDTGLTQMLTADGPLKQGETFEDRIDLVVKNVIQYTKTVSDRNTDKNVFYLKDYEATFKFKVYVQDILFENNGELKYIRQVNAYFVEPRFNDFYQLTISGGPFAYPSENVVVGEIKDTDTITPTLIKLLETFMDNLKYNEE